MPISIKCPECGRKLNAPDSAAGRRARCPQCKAVVTLPAAGTQVGDEVLDAEPVSAPPQAAGIGAAPPIPMADEPDPFDEIPLAAPAIPVAAPAAETTQPRRPCPMCGEM